MLPECVWSHSDPQPAGSSMEQNKNILENLAQRLPIGSDPERHLPKAFFFFLI